MRSLLISFFTFAALAAAVPHALRDRARGARPGSIAGRWDSYDGSCGTWGGATCRAGFCCGPNGWCGNAEEHCGAGCQSGFGDCGSESPNEAGPASQSPSGIPGGYGPPSSPTGPVTPPQPSPTDTTTSSSSVQSATEPSPTTYSSTVAETTTLEPAQPTSSVYSPSASSPSSSEPATSAPSSSGPPSLPLTPTESTSSTTSYSSATPTSTSYGGGSQSQGGPYIKTFTGDGSEGAGWPSQDQWLPFETLWEINQDIMNHSCSNAWRLGSNTDNTEQELSEVKAAIEDLAAQTQVDKGFIYVVMQQESLGCVRVRTTSNSHANPGLFQSNQGTGTCNDGTGLQIPCPESDIHQMVEDGVAGTASGDGLQQLLAQATGETAQKYYRTARMYNSGSLDASGSLGHGGATACYCSDIANRLLGWSQGTSQCTAAEVSA